MKIELKGNTSQEITQASKNLWGGFYFQRTGGGITFTQNYDGTIKTNGTSTTSTSSITVDLAQNGIYLTLPIGAYTVSGGKSSTKYVEVYDIDTSTRLARDTGNGEMFMLSATTRVMVRVTISTGVTVNNEVFNVMLEMNTSQTSYEPYSANSPSPEHPREVQTSTGNNIIKVTGDNKNVFAVTNLASMSITNNGSATHTTTSDKINITTGTGNYSGVYLADVYNYIDNYDTQNQYYVSFDVVANQDITFMYGESGGTQSTTTIGTQKVRLSQQYNPQKNLIFYSRSNRANDTIEVSNIMISTSSDTTYEAYIGQTYPIYLGGNAFDVNDITENTYIGYSTGDIGDSSVSNLTNFIYVIENTNYTLSFDYPFLSNSNNRGLCFYDENKNFVSGQYLYVNNKNQTVAIPNGIKYVRFAYDKNMTDIKFVADIPQIEVCTINNYQDKIYKDNGKWYLYKEIGKRVLTGVNEGWVFGNGATTPTPRTVIYTSAYSDFNYSQKYYSNRFKYNDTSTSNRLVLESRSRIYVSLDNTLTGISTSDTNAQKLEKMKTYISNNNIDTYYVLNTPTTTEITDTRLISQLEALLGVSSYQAQTNVSQENSSLDSPLDVTALQEM